jgi:hypothetical protein
MVVSTVHSVSHTFGIYSTRALFTKHSVDRHCAASAPCVHAGGRLFVVLSTSGVLAATFAVSVPWFDTKSCLNHLANVYCFAPDTARATDHARTYTTLPSTSHDHTC